MATRSSRIFVRYASIYDRPVRTKRVHRLAHEFFGRPLGFSPASAPVQLYPSNFRGRSAKSPTLRHARPIKACSYDIVQLERPTFDRRRRRTSNGLVS
ncbi:hypothetical protein PHBOTO_005809 [Pseudozyma hubeiensis]|nr:hypothetical protein PHBOTO_005809 [Pseudozyma hubeiensis]